MVLITAVIGPLFGNPAIEQIVRTLSVGCASATFLYLVYPARYSLFVRQNRCEKRKETRKSVLLN